MAIQIQPYSIDGITKSFPQTKYISNKSLCRVFGKVKLTSEYEMINSSLYDIINNSVVFENALSSSVYSAFEIRVADNEDELGDSLSDIAILASISNDIINLASVYNEVENVSLIKDEVVLVSNNIDTVTTVVNNMTDINTVSDNITGINTVYNNLDSIDTVVSNLTNIDINANDIDSINSVATALASGTGITAGGQYHGNGLIKGIEYFAQVGTTLDNIVIASGTNAISVDSFTIADGGSITIENNSVYKVI